MLQSMQVAGTGAWFGLVIWWRFTSGRRRRHPPRNTICKDVVKELEMDVVALAQPRVDVCVTRGRGCSDAARDALQLSVPNQATETRRA